jgi:hypothetical protein
VRKYTVSRRYALVKKLEDHLKLAEVGAALVKLNLHPLDPSLKHPGSTSNLRFRI